jgi:ATP-binding cassette subfamily B multidrug efflux pump
MLFRRFDKRVDPFQSYDTSLPPPQGVWDFLMMQLKPLRLVIAISLTLTVLAAGFEVWLIGYAGRLVDRLAAARDALWSSLGLELLVVGAFILLARPAAKLFREGLNDIVFRPNAETLVTWRMHRHVLRQSVGWFRNDFAGRIAAFVRQTGSSATGTAYSVIHTLAFVSIYIIGSIWLMASIDLPLVIPLLIWVVLYLGLMAWIVPRYRRASAGHQAAQSALMGMLVDGYANIDTIKLFADAREEDREAQGRFEEARQAFLKVQRLEVTINVSMTVLGSLLTVGLIGYAIVLWQAGTAPLGLIAAAVALSVQITGMAEWLLDAVSNLFGDLGALRQSLDSVGKPLEIVDTPDAAELVVSGGAIALSDVRHHYGKDDGGLEGLSLAIAAGEKVGIVGRSGAGKSTLVNLILRFFEAEAGRIEIDGQDVRSVTQESLRRQISMVTQEAALLHRSVRDNIAYGRVDVSQAEIEAAARKAHADGFIPGLQDQTGRKGYDAHVGERGVTLSGGQRQRIALARAILKDAPILILDEATSALDSEVEAAIQDTLYEVMEGKTVIAIAHRLSTLMRMDRIVVLDQGQIAEGGTHLELLTRQGIYAALWARQSKGFIGDQT